jgi:hypothetical protein
MLTKVDTAKPLVVETPDIPLVFPAYKKKFSEQYARDAYGKLAMPLQNA